VCVCVCVCVSGLFQVSIRREVQDGFVEPSLLQTLPPQKVFRDRNAEGVHPDGGGEGSEAAEDRREPISEEDMRTAQEDAFTTIRVTTTFHNQLIS